MQKQVLCTLPNASLSIGVQSSNIVEFIATADGVLSVPVDEAVAAQFYGIPGYTILDAVAPKTAKNTKTEALL